uniref:Uncharacterized protein n=1 Tax=Eptatretus burgeri TaxID=7764 RepID=A0A8C4QVV1_EPTBU
MLCSFKIPPQGSPFEQPGQDTCSSCHLVAPVRSCCVGSSGSHHFCPPTQSLVQDDPGTDPEVPHTSQSVTAASRQVTATQEPLASRTMPCCWSHVVVCPFCSSLSCGFPIASPHFPSSRCLHPHNVSAPATPPTPSSCPPYHGLPHSATPLSLNTPSHLSSQIDLHERHADVTGTFTCPGSLLNAPQAGPSPRGNISCGPDTPSDPTRPSPNIPLLSSEGAISEIDSRAALPLPHPPPFPQPCRPRAFCLAPRIPDGDPCLLAPPSWFPPEPPAVRPSVTQQIPPPPPQPHPRPPVTLYAGPAFAAGLPQPSVSAPTASSSFGPQLPLAPYAAAAAAAAAAAYAPSHQILFYSQAQAQGQGMFTGRPTLGHPASQPYLFPAAHAFPLGPPPPPPPPPPPGFVPPSACVIHPRQPPPPGPQQPPAQSVPSGACTGAQRAAYRPHPSSRPVTGAPLLSSQQQGSSSVPSTQPTAGPICGACAYGQAAAAAAGPPQPPPPPNMSLGLAWTPTPGGTPRLPSCGVHPGYPPPPPAPHPPSRPHTFGHPPHGPPMPQPPSAPRASHVQMQREDVQRHRFMSHFG